MSISVRRYDVYITIVLCVCLRVSVCACVSADVHLCMHVLVKLDSLPLFCIALI